MVTDSGASRFAAGDYSIAKLYAFQLTQRHRQCNLVAKSDYLDGHQNSVITFYFAQLADAYRWTVRFYYQSHCLFHRASQMNRLAVGQGMKVFFEHNLYLWYPIHRLRREEINHRGHRGRREEK